MKAWARAGILRSRRLPNGRLQVHLDDVLREREAVRVMVAFPDDTPVTEEERHTAREGLVPDVQAVLDELVRHLEPRLTPLVAPERR